MITNGFFFASFRVLRAIRICFGRLFLQIAKKKERGLENCKVYLFLYFPETIPSPIFEKGVYYKHKLIVGKHSKSSE
jgi:hypothetical protein